MGRTRRKNMFAKKRSILTAERIFLACMIAVLVISALVAYRWARPGQYEISNARPVYRERERMGQDESVAVWDIEFDARWEGREAGPNQTQNCTYSFVDDDGNVLREGAFGLFVNEGDTGVTLPAPVLERKFAGEEPASVTVNC